MVTTEIDDLRKTVVVRRRHLRRLLNTLTARPWRVMAIDCARRGDLEARYSPQSATKNGALVREGDYSSIDDADCRAGTHVFGAGRKYPIAQARRPGDRVVIQPAGTLRTVMVKTGTMTTPDLRSIGCPRVRHCITIQRRMDCFCSRVSTTILSKSNRAAGG